MALNSELLSYTLRGNLHPDFLPTYAQAEVLVSR
jgi:hypothetical protein